MPPVDIHTETNYIPQRQSGLKPAISQRLGDILSFFYRNFRHKET